MYGLDTSKVSQRALNNGFDLLEEAHYYINQAYNAISDGNLASAGRRMGLLNQILGEIRPVWDELSRAAGLALAPDETFFDSTGIIKEELVTYGMEDIAEKIAQMIVGKINFTEILSQVVQQSNTMLEKLLSYSDKHQEEVSKTMDVLVVVDEKFHTEYLEQKVEVLETLDHLDESLAEMNGAQAFESDLVERIDILKEKIGGYNFIQSTGQEMQGELEKLIQKMVDSSLNEDEIREEIEQLITKADTVIAESRQLKYELKAIPFKDTDDNEWFTQYVVPIEKEGIISGYKDKQGNPLGEYGPANNLTVAEILKIALESNGIGEGDGTQADTAFQNHWAAGYVVQGKALNVTLLNGVASEEDLNRPATRAEVVRILLEVKGTEIADNDAIIFEDAEGHVNEAYIETAHDLEIIDGYDDGTFRPDGLVNRAEAAKIVNLVMML
jgi:hypothetical protein